MFPFIKPIVLLGILILMVTLACGGSTPSTIVAPDSFSYPIRVLKEGTNEYVPNATVTIEVSGLAPLQGITDTNGFTRIFIDTSYVEKPARILIVANDYGPYRREIDLIQDALPDTISLKPLSFNSISESSSNESTPFSTPIATQVVQEILSPNAPEPFTDLTGKWDFWFKGYRSIDFNGIERDRNWDHRVIMELIQTGNSIIGKYIDATTPDGTVCNQANITGNFQPDGKIKLTIQYFGCCEGSKVSLEGQLITNNKIIGMLQPLGTPLPDAHRICNTWWANAEGNKL